MWFDGVVVVLLCCCGVVLLCCCVVVVLWCCGVLLLCVRCYYSLAARRQASSLAAPSDFVSLVDARRCLDEQCGAFPAESAEERRARRREWSLRVTA